MMGGLSVSYKFNSKGFRVHLASDSFKEKFTIQYPEEIWRSFPRRIRKTITENFVYLSTSSLASVMEEKHIDYEMNTPLLGSFFVKPLLYYIPFCSDEAQKDSLSILKQFMNTRYSFKSYNIRQPDYTAPVKDKAITLFTFGKDSLLSYALAEEFGMDPVPVYIEEPDIKFKDSKR